MNETQGEGAVMYRAFISYNHQDQRWAVWLQHALERYRVPRALRGTPSRFGPMPARVGRIFRDRDELPTATDLSAKVREALEQSAALIVVCSRQGARSRWVNEEVLYFQRLGRADRIFCLLVDGQPGAALAGREQDECLVPALRYGEDTDGAAVALAEPAAADPRASGDGKTNALLKLVAGLFDLPLAALRRRDQQRRMRRLVALATASSVGMLAMGALALSAYQSRNEAQRQRAEAEGLIEFMLGDLRDKLEPVGRLDALDSVGKRALDYYDRQDPAALGDDALLRRAKSLRLIGQIHDRRGQLDSALDVLGRASATTQQLLDRRPDDVQRLAGHMESLDLSATVLYHQTRKQEAETLLVQQLQLARRLVELEPGRIEHRIKLGSAELSVGAIKVEQGRYAEAIGPLQDARTVLDGLARERPQDRKLQVELALAYGWIAIAQMRLGPVQGPIDNLSAEIAILEALLQTDPRDASVRELLLDPLNRLSVAYEDIGDRESGLAAAAKVVEFAGQLVSNESGMHLAQMNRVVGLGMQSYLLYQLQRYDEALQLIDRAEGLLAGLPTEQTAMIMNASALSRLGLTRALIRCTRQGEQTLGPDLEELLRRIEALMGSERASSGNARAISEIHLLLGDAALHRGDRERAAQWWTQADGIARGNVDTLPLAQRALAALVALRRGDLQEARSQMEVLRETGYRGRLWRWLAAEMAGGGERYSVCNTPP